jgi:predicted dehydrogenase
MKFTAAVVGLGRIGQGYDYNESGSGVILTHALAYHRHRGFDLVAGVDSDGNERRRFEKKFEKPAYKTASEMFRKVEPQVISICTPTVNHFDVFCAVMKRKPAAVFCEKPLAANLGQGKKMLRTLRAGTTLCAVNYMRRFEPGILELKRHIDGGRIGKIYKGIVWYSKGLVNNASHFIDLLIFLLGPVTGISVLRRGREYPAGDLEPDIHLKFKDADVYFVAGREEEFTLSKLELIGTKGVVEYRDAYDEIFLKGLQKHPFVPSYTVLDRSGDRIPSDLRRYQMHSLDALYRALTKKTPLASDARTAFETLTVLDQIKTKHAERKRSHG